MNDRAPHGEPTADSSSLASPTGAPGAARQAERSLGDNGPSRPRRLGNERLIRHAARWLLAWLALTAGLAVWRSETLRWPPYWDCTIGLWTEANFLAETDFDYHRLRHEEKSVWQGGAKSYVISVLPALIALGMRSIESSGTLLLVAHLVSLGCAAAVLLLVYRLARHVAGAWPAVLVAAAVLTTPLFRVQLDMVGMELPMTAWALASALCLLRQRFVSAAALAMAAFAMKPTGGLLTLAGIVYAALWWLCTSPRIRLPNTAGATTPTTPGTAPPAVAVASAPERASTITTGLPRTGSHGAGQSAAVIRTLSTHRTTYLMAIAVLLGTWLVQLSIIRWSGTVATLMQPRYQHRMATLAAAVFWCPDLVVLWALSLWVTLGQLRRDLRDARAVVAATGSPPNRFAHIRRRMVGLLRVTHQWLVARPMLVLAWIVVMGTLLAIQRVSFLPRYLVVAVPFLWLVAGALWLSGSRRPRAAMLVFSACVAFNLLNARGAFYPSLKTYPGPHLARSGALLERSLEYQADHRANLAALACLVEQAADAPLIVTRPHVDFLAMPRLGYVRHPLHGWVVNNYSDLQADRFRPITSVDPSQLPADPVLVYTNSTWSRLSSVFDMPPPGADDTILFRDDGDPPLIVYRKGWPTMPPRRRDVDDWYLAHLWPNARSDDRTMYRIAWLMRHNRADDALIEARRAVERHPHNFYLRQWLMHLHLRQADLEAAIAAIVAAMPDDPRRTATWYAASAERGYAPPLSDIVPPSATALRTGTHGWPVAFAPLQPALLSLWQGNVADAERWLSAPTDDKANGTLTAICHACILLEEGFPREALARLRPALDRGRTPDADRADSAARWTALQGTLWHVAARASLHMGRVDSSQKMAQQAVAALADSGIAWAEARAWQTLGLAQWRAGRTSHAVESFRRSQSIDPHNHDTEQYLSHLTDGAGPAAQSTIVPSHDAPRRPNLAPSAHRVRHEPLFDQQANRRSRPRTSRAVHTATQAP